MPLTVVSDVVDPTFRFMTLDWDGKIRMDCSTFFLWVKRRVVIFVSCGALVGLAITLWPLLGWVFPWASW